jgi:hypothetical protein
MEKCYTGGLLFTTGLLRCIIVTTKNGVTKDEMYNKPCP